MHLPRTVLQECILFGMRMTELIHYFDHCFEYMRCGGTQYEFEKYRLAEAPG